MSRQTIQPNKKFLEFIERLRGSFMMPRWRVRLYTVEPSQSGPPPTPPKTKLTKKDASLHVTGLDVATWHFSEIHNYEKQLETQYDTQSLKEDLEKQLQTNSGDTVSGVKASELRAVALQSQIVNGFRRRSAKQQLNRIDRLVRSIHRRQLLANNDGPLQSILVRRVEDTLARVDSSS